MAGHIGNESGPRWLVKDIPVELTHLGGGVRRGRGRGSGCEGEGGGVRGRRMEGERGCEGEEGGVRMEGERGCEGEGEGVRGRRMEGERVGEE